MNGQIFTPLVSFYLSAQFASVPTDFLRKVIKSATGDGEAFVMSRRGISGFLEGDT
jgi:hypothetical protein